MVRHEINHCRNGTAPPFLEKAGLSPSSTDQGCQQLKAKKHKKNPLVLGITGSFASGKTTVASMFRRLGASGIDADKIYHLLIQPQGLLYKKIVSVFGHQIVGRDKKIKRKKLANLVFGKKKSLRRLCEVTHPPIIKRIKSELSKLKKIKGGIIVIDVPLLIEAGLAKMVDKLVVVKINRKNQITRCRKKGFSQNEVIKRIKAQIPLAKKAKLADYVIDNNGTLKQTRNQVKKIWKEICENS